MYLTFFVILLLNKTQFIVVVVDVVVVVVDVTVCYAITKFIFNVKIVFFSVQLFSLNFLRIVYIFFAHNENRPDVLTNLSRFNYYKLIAFTVCLFHFYFN